VRAIVVKPGERDSIHMRDMPDPPLAPDQVAVKTVRVGLCGTDVEIYDGRFGRAPDGDEFLILGHENFGVVQEVGRKVAGFKPGDLVVATVRRPCGVCYACAQGETDMCTSGRYEERGILGRHGYLAEYYVEAPRWLNRIPKRIADVAVLLEPTSVVEKAIDHAFLIQKRFRWKPKTALVLGGGPIGLLATAVLRLRGLQTHVVGREADSDPRARVASTLGATYHSVADKTLVDLQRELPPIDLAIEATGASRVAFDAMRIIGRSGVLCLLSVTGGSTRAPEPIDTINQHLVLGNAVVFGSVNANRRHFRMGVKDLVAIQRAYPGVLERVITERLPWSRYREWFGERRGGIKTTLEIESVRAPRPDR
jgi:glucose 1-dehydrogenase